MKLKRIVVVPLTLLASLAFTATPAHADPEDAVDYTVHAPGYIYDGCQQGIYAWGLEFGVVACGLRVANTPYYVVDAVKQ